MHSCCDNWPARCAVVIPCRNEAASIASLVRKIREQLPSVIVVDDGSTDETARMARDVGAEVIAGPALGKGAALRRGWEHAHTRGFLWALCLDGDGQHAPADIPKFLARAEETGAALVVGDRMHAASAMPLLRRWVNWWMSRELSSLAGRNFPDTQCGFRLLRLDVAMRLGLTADQYEIESEQLLAFAAAGERIEFVPIEVIYRNERSKVSPLRDTVRWFRWRREWLQRRKSFSANPSLRPGA